MKIAVIYTGDYDQVLRRTFNTREWTRYSNNANDICEALGTLGHDAIAMADGKRLIERLEAAEASMAWVVSGGIQGRNSIAHVPSILEMLGIPYVGSPPLVAAAADHKPTAKKLLAWSGVSTPAFQTMRTGHEMLNADLAFPLIIKPANGLCSCGLYKVRNEDELRLRARQIIHRYHAEALVETYIDGRDFTIPILQNGNPSAFPVIERVFFDREEAFKPDTQVRLPHEFSTLAEISLIPDDLDEELEKNLKDCAVDAFEALGISILGRVDIRTDLAGVPYCLEVNCKPDLTRDSLFAQSAQRIGMDYEELIKNILDQAIECCG